uniref:Ribonuclease H protein At1g65750 family n=1 Tax=Cajanus cajan TaxID=3821 RepID=A0A151RA90_CAJCA|nr:Putative ribonuclease H protein At1g65750 family [Cajanus cajan]
MRNVNTTYMMKNCWSLITEPHKLWVHVVRSKYNYLDKIIPRVTKRSKMSNLWQGICATWSLVTPHIHWRVKNGQTIRFWYDVWLPTQKAIIQKAITFVPPVELFKSVGDYVTDTREWNIERLQTWLPSEILELIQSLRPPHVDNDYDEIIWGPTPDGIFTTKSAYFVASPTQNDSHSAPFKAVWKWKGPERIRLFLWRVLHDSLLTNLTRFERGLGPDPTCSICMQEEEDTIHVLRDCEFAGEVWNKITGGAITRRSRNRDIQCWITSNLVRNSQLDLNWPLTFAFTKFMYNILNLC